MTIDHTRDKVSQAMAKELRQRGFVQGYSEWCWIERYPMLNDRAGLETREATDAWLSQLPETARASASQGVYDAYGVGELGEIIKFWGNMPYHIVAKNSWEMVSGGMDIIAGTEADARAKVALWIERNRKVTAWRERWISRGGS